MLVIRLRPDGRSVELVHTQGWKAVLVA